MNDSGTLKPGGSAGDERVFRIVSSSAGEVESCFDLALRRRSMRFFDLVTGGIATLPLPSV